MKAKSFVSISRYTDRCVVGKAKRVISEKISCMLPAITVWISVGFLLTHQHEE